MARKFGTLMLAFALALSLGVGSANAQTDEVEQAAKVQSGQDTGSGNAQSAEDREAETEEPASGAADSESTQEAIDEPTQDVDKEFAPDNAKKPGEAAQDVAAEDDPTREAAAEEDPTQEPESTEPSAAPSDESKKAKRVGAASDFTITPGWAGESLATDTIITTGSGNAKTVNFMVFGPTDWSSVPHASTNTRKLVIEYEKVSDAYDDGKMGFRLTDYTGKSGSGSTFENAKLKGVEGQPDIMKSVAEANDPAPNNTTGMGTKGRIVYTFVPTTQFDLATVQLSFQAVYNSGTINVGTGVAGNDYSAYPDEQIKITAYLIQDSTAAESAAGANSLDPNAPLTGSATLVEQGEATAKAYCPGRAARMYWYARQPSVVGLGPTTGGQLYMALASWGSTTYYGMEYLKYTVHMDLANTRIQLAANNYITYKQLLQASYPLTLGTGANTVTLTSRPITFRQHDGSALLDLDGDGFATQLELTGTHQGMYSAYQVEDQNQWTLVYDTTAEFAKYNNVMPQISFYESGTLGIEFSVDYQFSLSGRGPVLHSNPQVAVTTLNTYNTATVVEGMDVGVYNSKQTGGNNAFGAVIAATELQITASAPFYAATNNPAQLTPTTNNYDPWLQPNSTAFQSAYTSNAVGSADYMDQKGFLYYQAFESIQVMTARTAAEAAGASDPITFEIPTGTTLTHIVLPYNGGMANSTNISLYKYKNAEYKGASFPFDVRINDGPLQSGSAATPVAALADADKVTKVELGTPLVGPASITFYVDELQYIGKDSGDTESSLGGARIAFIGTTTGLTPGGNVTFKVSSTKGNSANLVAGIAEHGKIVPSMLTFDDIALVTKGTTNNGFSTQSGAAGWNQTSVVGAVQKGTEVYVRTYFRPLGTENYASYAGASKNGRAYRPPTYVDPLPHTDGTANVLYGVTPVFYFSIPSGLEIDTSDPDAVQLMYDKTNLTGLDVHGKKLKASISHVTESGYGLFTGGQKGANADGYMVEVDITDEDGNPTLFTNARQNGTASNTNYIVLLKLKIPADFDELTEGNNFEFDTESVLTNYRHEIVQKPLWSHPSYYPAPVNLATRYTFTAAKTSTPTVDNVVMFPEALAFSSAATNGHTTLPDADSPEWWFTSRPQTAFSPNHLLLVLPPSASGSASSEREAGGYYNHSATASASDVPPIRAVDERVPHLRYSMFYNVDGIPAAANSVI
ncbi:MAG: hypothetical protein LBR21_11555 [Propionibacteriaceae bacterium]|jgi:hypothetical protein|nr:hypothetical protein [Propionibacteriaceae bacterium]